MNQIKTKLLLIILPLLFSILFLGLYIFYEKYKQYNILENSSKLIAISVKISNLVHAIQIERDISASYAENFNPKYISVMKTKRKYTDAKYKLLLQLILNNSNHSLDIKDSIDNLYSKIKILRNNVDKKNKINIFKSYSDVVSKYLQFINQFSYLLSNQTLLREYNAYLILLLLQENAAKERGILSTVFEVNKLDAKKHMLLNDYSNKFDQLLNNFYNTAPKQYKDDLKSALQQQVVQNVDILLESIRFKSFRSYFLNDLLPILGFKGLIHNFKNYLIRGDEKLLKEMDKNYKDALKVIDEYYLLEQLSQQDKEKIIIIKRTLEAYINAVSIIKKMKSENKSISNIDTVIKIDDASAVNAIKYLSEYIGEISIDEWWEQSTKRIDLIKHISDDMQEYILYKSDKEKANTAQALGIFLIIFIFIILMSLILGILVMRRVVGDIIDTTNKINKMRKTGEYNYLFKVKGSDELSDMQLAFNQLVIDRDKAEINQKLSDRVFKNISEGIIILNDNMYIEAVNPSFNKITGYSFDEVKGKHYSIIHVEGNSQLFYLNIEKNLLQDNIWEGEFNSKRKNGELYPELLTISTLRDKDNNITKYLIVFRDITVRKLNEEKIYYQANYDSLTNIANRNKGLSVLKHELKVAKRNKTMLGLMFLDLDGFKMINDTYGHKCGDIVLKEIAQRFSKCVREVDNVVRFGGDEFIIILPNIGDINDIHRIAQKIINEATTPFVFNDKICNSLSVSIGISFYPQNADCVDSMIKCADEMMYKVKKSGKNNYMLFSCNRDNLYMI